MPAIHNSVIEKHRKYLIARFEKLLDVLDHGRSLKNANEGASGGRWADPDNMRMIDKLELSLVINDFKTILKELEKMK